MYIRKWFIIRTLLQIWIHPVLVHIYGSVHIWNHFCICSLPYTHTSTVAQPIYKVGFIYVCTSLYVMWFCICVVLPYMCCASTLSWIYESMYGAHIWKQCICISTFIYALFYLCTYTSYHSLGISPLHSHYDWPPCLELTYTGIHIWSSRSREGWYLFIQI